MKGRFRFPSPATGIATIALAPASDGASWQVFLVNIDSSAASGTAFAVCLK